MVHCCRYWQTFLPHHQRPFSPSRSTNSPQMWGRDYVFCLRRPTFINFCTSTILTGKQHQPISIKCYLIGFGAQHARSYSIGGFLPFDSSWWNHVWRFPRTPCASEGSRHSQRTRSLSPQREHMLVNTAVVVQPNTAWGNPRSLQWRPCTLTIVIITESLTGRQ